MKRLAVVISLLCITTLQSAAQTVTPKYVCSPDNSGASFVGLGSNESIYYPGNFPGMPAGTITAMYIRVGRVTANKPSYTYYGFKVRMKPTEATKYAHGGSSPVVKDTLLISSNGNIVANYATWNVPGPVKQDDWIRIPLNAANFYYSGTQNFAVQITSDSLNTVNGAIPYDVACNTAPSFRNVGFANDSIRGVSVVNLPMIGFDIMTTGVQGLNGSEAIAVHPVPATNELFVSGAPANARYAITDITGRVLLSGSHDARKAIDVSGLSAGMYLLTTICDGAAVGTAKFMKE